MRSIKFGTIYGKPTNYFNGCGQGDLCSLFPAIALVSGQFFMVELLYPKIRMGAQIDDRNFRGNLDEIIATYYLVHDFDKVAGHILEPSKTVFAAATAKERARIRTLSLHGHTPKCPNHFVLVGDGITGIKRKISALGNVRTEGAMKILKVARSRQLTRKRFELAAGSAIVPRGISGTQWNLPSFPCMSRFRTAIMKGTWSNKSRMRCLEILMTLVFDPTRIDPFFASLYRAYSILRRLLRKGGDRYFRFVETMTLAILQKETNIVGPVHGFLDACRHLRVTIALEDHGLRLVSPYGTGIDVLDDNRTLFNLVIRDSIQFAILQQLDDRTSDPCRIRYRKDLAGADPYIDIAASRVNLTHSHTLRRQS